MTETEQTKADLTLFKAGGVWALGNFDGVHLGHRLVATRAAQEAHKQGLAAYALSLAPHPYQFFQKDSKPFALMSPRAKNLALRQCGLEEVLTLPFTQDLAEMKAEAFIEKILIGTCRARHLVVGSDYAFGAGRGGDAVFLREKLEPLGLGVSIVPPLCDPSGLAISSSRVREAVRQGDMQTAKTLLGSPFTIDAHVEKGDQRGRKLGFPTANMALGSFVRPRYGVYAALGRSVSGAGAWRGVANIGLRPTIGGARELLETHLFGFDQDIYGQLWQIELHAFLRGEEKFASLADLQAQMGRDAEAAKAFWAG